MRDYVASTVEETLSYLKEHMGMKYYDKVETGQIFKSNSIFEGLVNLCYHTVLQDDGKIAKNHCGVDPTANIDRFFIGM
jgi:hypothetical protein